MKQGHPGWWIIILLAGAAGCYEPVEDCLDTAATNFRVGADRPCSDCCEYPTWRLRVRHRWVYPDTTVNFRLLDSVYLDNSGQPFRIQDLQFYLSNLRFLLADGAEAGVTDLVSAELYSEDGSVELSEIEDNFALVAPSRVQSYTIGTYRSPGPVVGLRFDVGLDSTANRAVPASLPDDHPLAPQPSDLYWSIDSGYVFYEIAILRDTTAADTIPTVLEIGTPAYRREVTLPFEATIPEGFDLELTLQVDYRRWFGGIQNVRTDSEAVLIEAIVSNLAQSFSVVDIEAE